MRMNLAVLDWVRLKYSMYVCLSVYIHIHVVQNENVNRHSTSERQVRDLRRPDRHTPMKVLVKKSYSFVEKVWAAYLELNHEDHRCI